MAKFKGLLAAATLALGLPMAASAQQLDFVKTYSLPSGTAIQDVHVEGDDLYVVWDTNYAIYDEQGVAVQKLAADGSEQWRYMLASYYTDWSDPTELEFARDTAANQQGLYFIHDDSNGKSIVATSPEGENLWSVAAQNSGWFSEDYPKTDFTELYAADDVLYVKGSITETQGAQAVGYLFAYDQSGDEISREQDANAAKFNAEKFAGSVNYSVDYDANTITVLADDGSVSQVIESNNPIQSVAYGNDYFYVTQSTGTVTDGGYRLVRYDLDGDLLVLNAFSPKFAKTDASTTAVKVDAQGIYTFGYQFTAECCDSEKTYRLAQYTLDGELTSAKYYRDIPQSQPWTLLTVEQGAAYLQIGEAVSDDVYETLSNYIAKIDLSDSAYFALPELSIHAMEQLPVSGEPGLAVVSQGVAENTLIQEVIAGASQSAMAQDLQPQVGRQLHIDSALYPNDDGSVQLATLMQSKSEPSAYGQPVQAELKTEVALSQSDDIDIYADSQEQTVFNQDVDTATPLELIVIPDQNGNGTYELGVVSELPNKGGVFLEVRDPNGDSDKPMFRVSFNPNFSPKDVALVQDLDGDDRPEIALLSVNDSKGQSKVEIRSLDGNLIKNLWPGNSHKAEFFVEPQLDDRFAPVPAAELAVVQVKAEGKGVRVVTLDVATGKPVKYKGLNPNFIPVKAVAMPDINNNGASEYAILSQNTTMVDGAEQLKARIDIVDTASNKTINQIWHRKNATVYDLAVVPDQNGNQTVELATAIWQDGGLKLKIQDGLTDALISTQSLKVVH